MFGPIHIHEHGTALCHAGEGIYINFEDAAGMNHQNCCPDCLRRYLNIAKMKRMDWNYKNIDKALLRGQSTQETRVLNRFQKIE